jgi:hypothetical protein
MEINTSWENIVDLFQLALWPLFDKLSIVEFTGLDDKELNLASSYHDVCRRLCSSTTPTCSAPFSL